MLFTSVTQKHLKGLATAFQALKPTFIQFHLMTTPLNKKTVSWTRTVSKTPQAGQGGGGISTQI